MPNAIAENLQRLISAKNAIANAITAKGGTVTAGDGMEDFAADIATIPSGIAPEDLCLKFVGTESFTLKQYNVSSKTWDGTLEYSTDLMTWTEWDKGSTVISSSSSAPYVLYLRGINNTKITNRTSDQNYRFVFTTNGTIDCIGKIDTLLDYRLVAFGYTPSMGAGSFAYMFYGCTVLTSAPILHPTVSESCYCGMFYGCTALTTPPALPAEELQSYCYREMFRKCTSLTALPKLPALKMETYCYYEMFYNCTNIKLSTTQIDEYQTPYRIPTEGTGVRNQYSASYALLAMFYGTGGTYTTPSNGEPSLNTEYYTSNTVV